MLQLEGVIVPILTPIHKDETPNYDQLRTLTDYVIDGGVNAIFANGTTGEFARFHEEEQAVCLQTIIEQTARRVPVLAGVSSCGTRLTIEHARAAEAAGAEAVVTTFPYYFPTTSHSEQIHFLEDVTSSVKIPVILYNIPAAAGFSVSEEVLDEVAGLDNLYGIKDTSGSREFMDLLLGKYHDRLKVYVGDESMSYYGLSRGADGVVPSLANAFPKVLASEWEAVRRGDLDACRRYCDEVDDMNRMNRFSDSWMSPNIWRKEALSQMGIIDSYFTQPYNAPSDADKTEIAAFIKRYRREYE